MFFEASINIFMSMG